MNQVIPEIPVKPRRNSAVITFAAVFSFICFLSFVLFSESSSVQVGKQLINNLKKTAFQFSASSPVQTPEPTVEPSAKPQATPIPFLKTTIAEPYTFIRDNAVWYHKDTETTTKISTEEQQVVVQVLSPNGQFLAYSWGDQTEKNYFDAHTITIVNLKTGVSKNLHSVKDRVLRTSIEDENFKLVDLINGIVFSQDSSLLAFATRQEIYLVNLPSLQSRRVYQNTLNKDAKRETGLIYSFSGFAFSPDKKKLFVQFHYYEGIGSYVLTLDSGAMSQVEGSYHGYGNYVVGWLDSQHLATVIGNSLESSELTSIFSYDLRNKKATELFILPGTYPVFIIDSKLYLMTQNLVDTTIHPLTLFELEVDLNLQKPTQFISYKDVVERHQTGKVVIGMPFSPNDWNFRVYSFRRISPTQFLAVGEDNKRTDYFVYDTINQTLQIVEENLRSQLNY